MRCLRGWRWTRSTSAGGIFPTDDFTVDRNCSFSSSFRIINIFVCDTQHEQSWQSKIDVFFLFVFFFQILMTGENQIISFACSIFGFGIDWISFSIPVPQIKLCRRRSVMCLLGNVFKWIFSPDGIWWLVVMRVHIPDVQRIVPKDNFLSYIQWKVSNQQTHKTDRNPWKFFHNELKMNFIDIIIGSYIIIWFPVTWQFMCAKGVFTHIIILVSPPFFFFFFFFRPFFYYSLSKNVLPHVFIYIQLIFFSKFLLFHG